MARGGEPLRYAVDGRPAYPRSDSYRWDVPDVADERLEPLNELILQTEDEEASTLAWHAMLGDAAALYMAYDRMIDLGYPEEYLAAMRGLMASAAASEHALGNYAPGDQARQAAGHQSWLDTYANAYMNRTGTNSMSLDPENQDPEGADAGNWAMVQEFMASQPDRQQYSAFRGPTPNVMKFAAGDPPFPPDDPMWRRLRRAMAELTLLGNPDLDALVDSFNRGNYDALLPLWDALEDYDVNDFAATEEIGRAMAWSMQPDAQQRYYNVSSAIPSGGGIPPTTEEVSPEIATRRAQDYVRRLNTASAGFYGEGPVRKSALRSPAGGVVVRGIHYPGGKWIPASGPEKATYEQYHQIHHYQRADGSWDNEKACADRVKYSDHEADLYAPDYDAQDALGAQVEALMGQEELSASYAQEMDWRRHMARLTEALDREQPGVNYAGYMEGTQKLARGGSPHRYGVQFRTPRNIHANPWATDEDDLENYGGHRVPPEEAKSRNFVEAISALRNHPEPDVRNLAQAVLGGDWEAMIPLYDALIDYDITDEAGSPTENVEYELGHAISDAVSAPGDASEIRGDAWQEVDKFHERQGTLGTPAHRENRLRQPTLATWRDAVDWDRGQGPYAQGYAAQSSPVRYAGNPGGWPAPDAATLTDQIGMYLEDIARHPSEEIRRTAQGLLAALRAGGSEDGIAVTQGIITLLDAMDMYDGMYDERGGEHSARAGEEIYTRPRHALRGRIASGLMSRHPGRGADRHVDSEESQELTDIRGRISDRTRGKNYGYSEFWDAAADDVIPAWVSSPRREQKSGNALHYAAPPRHPDWSPRNQKFITGSMPVFDSLLDDPQTTGIWELAAADATVDGYMKALGELIRRRDPRVYQIAAEMESWLEAKTEYGPQGDALPEELQGGMAIDQDLYQDTEYHGQDVPPWWDPAQYDWDMDPEAIGLNFGPHWKTYREIPAEWRRAPMLRSAHTDYLNRRVQGLNDPELSAMSQQTFRGSEQPVDFMALTDALRERGQGDLAEEVWRIRSGRPGGYADLAEG